MARLTKRTRHGWELAAPCAPGVSLAMRARYENIGSAHQFRHLSELNTPKSPYPDGDTSILECPCCGSGEWLHNADESKANFCGQCGQAIESAVIERIEQEAICGIRALALVAYIVRLDMAREINSMLKRLPGWRSWSSIDCGPIYGKQRGFAKIL